MYKKVNYIKAKPHGGEYWQKEKKVRSDKKYEENWCGWGGSGEKERKQGKIKRKIICT